MSRDLVQVSEWCDLCGMKLNASKTKTMIVSRSSTMHRQSPALTIGSTLLKESDDLVVLGVTFNSKMTFEKHLRSVSRAASQRLGIFRNSWQVLTGGVFECDHAHRRSVAVLCMLYKIRCNPLDHVMVLFLCRVCRCGSHAALLTSVHLCASSLQNLEV